MGDGAYLTALNVTMQKCNAINNLEMRLLALNTEKNLKYIQGCAETSEYSTQMAAEVDAIKAQLGDDYTSEEYQQNMAECESVENEYGVIIQNIQDQMEAAEEQIDLQKEDIETRLEVLREEYDQWSELSTTKAENNGYFNSN